MDDVKDAIGDQWRADLLKDVRTLPNIGAVPGTLVVFGELARPILLNPQQKSVWVAAGELGEGRIVVISHAHYIRKLKSNNSNKHEDIAKYHENIKLWLTKFATVDNSEIKLLTSLTVETLSSARIIIVAGNNNPDIPDEMIYQFVESGGALLHSICPWGWLQVHPELTLQDVPLYSILEEVGILYTDGYFRCPENGMLIASCVASESYHMKHALENMHLDKCCRTLSQINEVPLKSLHDIVATSGQLLRDMIAENGKDNIPSERTPISSTMGKSTIYVHEALAKTGNGPSQMPGVDNFPGDFVFDPPRISTEIIIESMIDACHPTGFYVRAGDEISIEVLNDQSIDTGWEIQVGSHTDRLHTSLSMKRWPIIAKRFKITVRQIKTRTPFGGLLYVRSPRYKGRLVLHVRNVVQAPYFDLTRPETINNWHENRQAPGLWADICGQHIVFTLPSSSIRNIEDPRPALETLDLVVRAHHHLRGSDPNTIHREWIVTDIQPAGGHMHSGYPIVTHLDLAQPDNAAFLLNSEQLLEKGNWSLFHELGHNMQRPVWTFAGTTEVTCNIFTLHAMDVISKRQIWLHPWLKSKVETAQNYIKHSCEYAKWQSDPGIGLFVYAQIIHQFGWSVFKKTFRHYENNDRSAQLKTDGDKVDCWFQSMTKFAEYNLAPLADLWNIPLSSGCREQMKAFQPFLPEDEITEAVPEKVKSLIEVYPALIRKIVKPKDAFEELRCCPKKWTVQCKILA
ncbi:hypothetical protein SNE40_014817 [Patella caerulea]|uniref:Peptidase M60 domain-containing protein n=1 Tax=Patella caerulea TaxID=87958 RepID=A0AAN8JJE8_PATCE